MASSEDTSRSSGGEPKPAAPSISLPRGGGAIRGIGEKVAANPTTGTASMSLPLATSPGRSGFGPQLSLAYDSGSPNGPFGFGWSLSIPALTRKTDKGLPQYRDAEESDTYILSGVEDLVPVVRPDGTRFADDTTAPGFVIHRYRPRIEGSFARIERWTNAATGEIHWRSITRDNVSTLYGRDANSRVADPADPDPVHPTRVFSWLICESHDDKGNAIVYEYAAENDDNVDRVQAHERNRARTANRYLKRIRYGNRVSRLVQPDLTLAQWLFEVVFDYEEGHYEDVPGDPSLPEDEQHRFVLASESAGATWAVRPDPFSSYRAGFEVRTYRRCHRVLMFHHIPDLPTGEKGYDGLVRCTEFDYADLDYSLPVSVESELAHQGSTRFASFIRSVTQAGFVRDDTRPVVVKNGVSYATYLRRSLPPLELDYSKAAIRDEVLELDERSLENLPAGLDGASYRWVDLDGEGVSGILTEQAGAWFYKPNLGEGRFGPTRSIADKPSLSGLARGRQQLLDLAGDGLLDVVTLADPAPGFYERTPEGGWEPFRAFRALPNVQWDDPNLRFVDLDGDGHADILITEQDVFTWYPSRAEEGFAPARRVRSPLDEEHGPRLVLADGMQSVYLADMSGDGLSDLVRIRNGEACYWPNLGHGRFGGKVAMDDAPHLDSPDQFEQRRIRLADVDGSGTTDIVYLARDGVRLYFNQSGNRWSGARRLDHFPAVDNVASVATVDLLGNGTACLAWSSPLPGPARRPLRYVDLTGGTKPHLLIRVANNLGAETEVRYAPSTRFYLADKRDGRPWVTRLPFPVHVVERVVTRDLIGGNRFVTRYAYHHGHFDGTEREFRGFGMVEQYDTEEFAVLDAGGQPPSGANVDESSHVPPVLTRTWFHTGVHVGRGHISDYFAGLLGPGGAGEYFREPGATDAQARALLLEDTVLPDGLSADDEREACRALKGSMLRQEIYALDGTEREPLPYTVAEQNFTVRVLQPRTGRWHGVFFTHPREAISYRYDRSLVPVLGGQIVDAATASADPLVQWLPDPRVAHTLTLEVDDFGNVLTSATVGYGRRYSDLRLPSPADREKQTGTLVVCSVNRVTRSHDTGADAIDTAEDYRTPLPCESRSYELTGLTAPMDGSRFSLDDILTAVTTATDLDYEAVPTPGLVERRLIEHVRTYYRRDDLSGALPLGDLQSLALPHETYKLAFTPGLLTAVYGGRLTSAMLADDGRYVHTEGDANWWIPGGRTFYSTDPGHTPAQELAHARQHFFLGGRYRDPFHSNALGTESFVTHDAYDLLMQETRDALGNRVTVGERNANPDLPPVRLRQDYRVLQPALVMDPNRNRTEVAFDALGMVVGTAVMGKPEDLPVPGDALAPTFHADLTRAEIDQFLADPRGAPAVALLDEATTRTVYDLTAYWREPDPARKPPTLAATIARETHASEPLPAGGLRVQVGFGYSDGFGREIQKKAQAEPGPVPTRGVDGKVVVGPDGQPQMTVSDVSPRWVGSGWTVFNNKGKPIRQYEPFFTDTHRFELDVRIGVGSVLFYDPVVRVVATLHPNHAWEKVVFDPWRQETWDPNDTVSVASPADDAHVGALFGRLPGAAYLPTWHALRTDPAFAAAAAQQWPDLETRNAEKRAAEKTAIHAGTPTVVHTDALGRVFLVAAHNRFKYSDTPPADPPLEETQHTRTALDVEGNERAVLDALDRVVMRYDYDMLGNRIHQASMESGERWTLSDVVGKPLYAWDDQDRRFHTTYDQLRRPADSVLREGAAAPVVIGRIVYGESRPNPEAANLRGKVVQAFDQAGVVTSDLYDFRNNLLRSGRQLARSYDATLDWSTAVPLEAQTFTSRTRHDALNRPVQLIAPHDGQPGSTIHVVQPSYNEANLLERVHAWLDENAEPAALLDPATANLEAVSDLDYDAKGQRRSVDWGNGARTVYEYDPLTFRMRRLSTRRDAVAFPDDCPDPAPGGWPGCHVQSLHYTYDPAGNVTGLRDDAQQAIFFRNKRVDASADLTYDALYRLIEAKGREHLGQVGGSPVPHSYDDSPRAGRPHPGDGNAMGLYLERYVYDVVGNLLAMQHRGRDPAHPGWTRAYSYEEPSLLEPGKQSNRLTRTTVGATTESYSVGGDGYDAHGTMRRMPHLQAMQWDFKDQLRMTARQAVDPSDADGVEHQGERTWYVYDSAGTRVRKVTELPGGQVAEERVYLAGFELYRRHGTAPLVRETLHIMDDSRRIALVETRTLGSEPGVPKRLFRFKLGNHLGSAAVELDDQARVISYEEYTPYGSTSYQAVRSLVETPKRYRYIGKERDAETGLYQLGARYYAPWLGRWIAADPGGLVDGSNLYRYSRNNPVILKDPGGLDPNDDTVDLGPFRLGDFRLTGLSGGASFRLGIHGIGTDEPLSLSVDTAALAGVVSVSSSLGIPSLGLEGGHATFRLDLRDVSVADERVHADVRGRALLETGPLSISFLTYADVRAHLDRRIVLSRWREHLQRTVESASGSVEVFATPRLFNQDIGFFALRAESEGGGEGTTSLHGRIGLGGLTLGRITGTGTFTTGSFADDEWVPGTFNLAGSFWAVGPGVAFGNWSFDLNRGLSASGHYFGTQFGPFGLNIGINPTGNVSDDTTYWRYRDAVDASPGGPDGPVQMYEPGTSFGYTYFNYSSTNRFFLSVGVSPSSSVVPYFRGGASQPDIPLLGTFDIGPKAPDGGVYAGARLNWAF